MEKYSDIHNLAQLEASQKRLSRKLSQKGSDIRDGISNLGDSYSPMNILGSAFRSLSALIPVDLVLLNILAALKARLTKQDE